MKAEEVKVLFSAVVHSSCWHRNCTTNTMSCYPRLQYWMLHIGIQEEPKGDMQVDNVFSN